jgi:HD superfamily phosphohydrolase
MGTYVRMTLLCPQPATNRPDGLLLATRCRPLRQRRAYSACVAKELNEIRDPVHVFVEADPDELAVVNSRPFQRLRHIHQLALTYLIYPGATHRRFEHSLGVMQIAGRIYDVVMRDENLSDIVREVVPSNRRKREYWRSVLRMAALCHDIGHLPFSHAAEKDLLPERVGHEQITRALIESELMKPVWDGMRPRPEPEDVVKLALGPKEAPDLTFDTWEAILAEMIVGEVFGADRTDYLLRDSLHTGVAYGRFDHHRLIQTMRILPPAPDLAGGEHPPTGEEAARSTLGVVRGGLESAEGLLIARYFMFSQVYFHPTRLIYDTHLKEFLQLWLADRGGRFPGDPEGHLEFTDNEVMAAISAAARNSDNAAHEPAWRITNREHFRVFYERAPQDVAHYPEAATAIYEAAKHEFGAEQVRYRDSRKAAGTADFPVRDRDGKSVSSLSVSQALQQLPEPRNEYVYVVRERREDARKWVDENRRAVIEAAAEAEKEEAE